MMFAPGVLERDVEPIVREYRTRGFAHVPGVVSGEMLERLRERAADVMHGRVTYEGLFFQLDTSIGNGWQGPSDEYRKIEKLEKDPLFRSWVQNPFFERIARAVIEGDISIYRAILMTKGARGGSVLPWHQDAGKFWGLDRDPPLQIWTALDDAPKEAGCMEVFEGSHAAGLVTPLGGLVQEPHVSERNANALALSVPARAGDVVVLHNHLWHRSGLNTTSHTRRAFSVCYMSAATKCTRTKRTARTFMRVFA